MMLLCQTGLEVPCRHPTCTSTTIRLCKKKKEKKKKKEEEKEKEKKKKSSSRKSSNKVWSRTSKQLFV
jgi:hypothetical protein